MLLVAELLHNLSPAPPLHPNLLGAALSGLLEMLCPGLECAKFSLNKI